MGFDSRARHRCLLACALTWAGLEAASCAHGDPRRFALAEPVLRDQDLDLVSLECHPDPSQKDPRHASCAPLDYESSFAWDAADNSIFRPTSKFFQIDPGAEAKNVNAFDEVPDSSWFTNRIGAKAMSAEQVARGYCSEGPELSSDPADGSWLIDHGKDNGANPGFRVRASGTKFMLKTDDFQVERATAATAIASRFYYAAGWWAPCDSVVYFKRSALRLKPGLTVKANVGPARPFDEEALSQTLSKTGRRGQLYRAAASRWLPGKAIGPFTYDGVRNDDPSDVIAHEDRRDLRGARLLAAWLNHFDSREQNTMSTWMPADPKNPRSPGYVRHWYIDLGDCFGSEWSVDGFSRRFDHSYVLDVGYMLEDFATLGVVQRPWDRARRTPGAELFGYFTARDFDPSGWRGEYPNPAFGRMTEHDGAWAARIIARFTPSQIEAAVRVGDFTNPLHAKFLTDVLIARQHILLRRYLGRLSPVTDVSVEGAALCAVDLARRTQTFGTETFQYRATLERGVGGVVSLPVSAQPDGRICVPLAAKMPPSGLPDDAPERYLVVRISNGASQGPLVLHLYDLGKSRGLRLVGIERPDP